MTSEKRNGLTDDEVNSSREKFGTNTVETENRNSFFHVLKEIVFEPLFIILVGAAIIYFALGESIEGIIMLVALAFVSGISLYQENKSRNAVDALKKLSSPRAKVIRNGVVVEIISEDIVVGDLIVVADGNIVPADAVVIEAHDFSVNESILTGEALPVTKESLTPPYVSGLSKGEGEFSKHRDIERVEATIYLGTMIMTGSCIAQVVAIGKQTKLGNTGESLDAIEVTATPLQLQIKSFVRSMVGIGVIAFLIVWGTNYYLSKNILNALLHGLTLAMSVLPEEIPVAFSTFMALGAYHLYKKKVIARSPHTVETLGAATVICVDKTGTITENEMQIAAIFDFTENKTYDYRTALFNLNNVLEYAMWSSEMEPFDAMEKAIHKLYGEVVNYDKRLDFKMIHEYPLAGNPPVMTHVFSNHKTENIIAVKGSVEGVLNQCELSTEQKAGIQKQNSSFASNGFRVLAVASSNHDVNNLPATQLEFEFVFIGLIAFYDPPKQNMKNILKQFYDAGIQVKMITGDYAETAAAIAKQINFKNTSAPLTGDEVMTLADEQLREKVKTTNIFARMFPDAKLKVIEALKANGEIVAMTGDGVNDGPALKAAHIGIAMGLRGSELAKKAASLILMDDDLSHMVDAVVLGRRIYENLKKAIQYIISIHIPIILIVTVPLVLFWKFTNFFSPVHVIFLELIMGPTCSIIFENEPIEADSMTKPPRQMGSSFFSFKELSLSIVQGLVITAACLGSGYYFMMNNYNESEVRTVIYATLIFSNLFLTLVNRSFYYSIFTTLCYKNNLIPLVLAVSLLVLFLSIYVEPVRNIFQFTELPITDLLFSFGVAFAGVIWMEFYKMNKRHNH